MFAAKEEKKHISLDAYEEGAVIKALNEMRTKKIADGKTTDVENGLILGIIRPPARKPGVGSAPATTRVDAAGRGGAATQTGKREPRRRDEAR